MRFVAWAGICISWCCTPAMSPHVSVAGTEWVSCLSTPWIKSNPIFLLVYQITTWASSLLPTLPRSIVLAAVECGVRERVNLLGHLSYNARVCLMCRCVELLLESHWFWWSSPGEGKKIGFKGLLSTTIYEIGPESSEKAAFVISE